MKKVKLKTVADILIVDDQSLYREGLVELVKKWSEYNVVGEAHNGRSALEQCKLHRPQLVLMDIKMPVMNGLDACAEIKAQFSDIDVVILSLYCDKDRVLTAIQNGADGYLLKNIHANELRHKLQSVLAGGAALSDEAAKICIESLRSPRFVPVDTDGMSLIISTLTDHEIQLLKLISKGYANRDIAQKLYVGESTVKKQVSLLLTKLNLNNRVQAAVFALRSGLADE